MICYVQTLMQLCDFIKWLNRGYFNNSFNI